MSLLTKTKEHKKKKFKKKKEKLVAFYYHLALTNFQDQYFQNICLKWVRKLYI